MSTILDDDDGGNQADEILLGQSAPIATEGSLPRPVAGLLTMA
jgi:hypothetical protein